MARYHDEAPEADEDPEVAAENHRCRLEGCRADAEIEREMLRRASRGEYRPSLNHGGAGQSVYEWIVARGD